MNIRASNIIHVVTDCDAERATRAHMLFSMGYHVEVYSCTDELLAHSPDHGIIFMRDDSLSLCINLLKNMRSNGFYLPIIGYCKYIDIDALIANIKSGISYFLLDTAPIDTLKEKIELIILNSKPIRVAYDNQFHVSLLMATLSKREDNVLNLLANGLTSKEIARELGISPRTIEIHRRNILQKLSVKTTIHAVRMKLQLEICPCKLN